MTKLIEYIWTLIKSKFYGELRIRFSAGNITNVTEEKSLDIKEFST